MPDLSWPLDGWSLWAYTTTAHSPYRYRRCRTHAPGVVRPAALQSVDAPPDDERRISTGAQVDEGLPLVVWQGDDDA